MILGMLGLLQGDMSAEVAPALFGASLVGLCLVSAVPAGTFLLSGVLRDGYL